MLMYPIIFAKNPSDHAERAIEAMFVGRERETAHSLQAYLDAVQGALASRGNLSELLPQPHSDAVIRAYLAEVQHKLEERLRKHA